MWLFEPPQWQLHKGLLPGIEPRTFWSKSRRANHTAILFPYIAFCTYDFSTDYVVPSQIHECLVYILTK